MEKIKKLSNPYLTEQQIKQMAEENYPLAISIAKRFYNRLESKQDFEDVVGYACEGLVRCLYAFNPTLGFKFSTYAVPYVQGYVYRKMFCIDRDKEKKLTKLYYEQYEDAYYFDNSFLDTICYDGVDTLEEKMLHDEDIKHKLELIQTRLPREEDVTIVMLHIKGMTQPKIADKLGIPQVKVSRRLKRCREILSNIELAEV